MRQMVRRIGSGLGAALLAPIFLTVVAPPLAGAAAVAGTPWTWGANSYGELGTGGTASRLAAAAVGLGDVVDLHGGREHVVALRSDGSVWTWGSNQHGQLGVGGSANRSTPVQVPGLSAMVAVETGHNHSMALGADGSVWSWGYNADGQLGDGTTTLRRTPVRVAGLSDAVAIAGGRDMAYAIRADGTVVGWGRNDEGQLGDGTTTRRLTPVRVGALNSVVDLAGGRDHGLAVRADGSVWAWGSNDYGQLGLGNAGSNTDRLVPTEVAAPAAAEVIAGAHHSYARALDGTVWSWGRNYRANLGDGTTTQRTRPVRVGGVSGAVSIGSGRDHGLAVLADGRVMAWGENGAGQLGDGTTTDRPVAVVVPGVSDAVEAGGGGAYYSVVLVGVLPPDPDPDPDPDPEPVVTQVGSASQNANTQRPTVSVPGSVQEGDRLVLVVTTNRAATLTAPPGWTIVGEAADGSDLRSWVLTRAAPAGAAGSMIRVDLDAFAKTATHLLAYRDAGPPVPRARADSATTALHAAPAASVTVAGSAAAWLWVDKVSTAHDWTLPSGLVVRGATRGSGGGLVTSVLGDRSALPAGALAPVTADASVASGKAIGWTMVLPPG